MRDLPEAIITVLRQFELAFSERVWEWAKILLVGAILAPGKRTVTAALGMMAPFSSRTSPEIEPVVWARTGLDKNASKTAKRSESLVALLIEDLLCARRWRLGFPAVG